MKNKVIVDRPSKTVIVNKNYVYLKIGSSYDKLSKQTRPKRVLIGKLTSDNKLMPNSSYYEYFDTPLLEPDNRADSVIVGPYVVFDSIIEKFKLDTLLVGLFENANKILDIAYYYIISESNASTYFEDYAYNHLLYSPKSFSDSTIGDLLKNISDKDIDTFFNAWCKINPKNDIYISYDSTNINTVAGNIDLAEYGVAKDNDEFPQVNISLAYDQSNSIPLFYDAYEGSIIDNTECALMVERAKRYGFKDIGFILDRGYFSLRNIRFFDENNYSFIIMAKASALFIKETIEEVRFKLKNSSNYFLKGYGISGLTIERKISDKDKKKRYFHIYLDDEKAAISKKEILNRFLLMDEDLTNKVNKKITKKEVLSSYEKYYSLKFDDYGYLKSFKRKDKVIDALISDAGCFVIITSKKMSALDALDTYRNRDSIEKLFRAEKSYMGFDCFKVHDDTRLKAKLFILFIALIVRTEVYNCLKPLYLKDSKNFTVPKAIKELEKLYVTKLADNKYHQRYLLTAKQKKILTTFNISEESYKNTVNELLQKLN